MTYYSQQKHDMSYIYILYILYILYIIYIYHILYIYSWYVHVIPPSFPCQISPKAVPFLRRVPKNGRVPSQGDPRRSKAPGRAAELLSRAGCQGLESAIVDDFKIGLHHGEILSISIYLSIYLYIYIYISIYIYITHMIINKTLDHGDMMNGIYVSYIYIIIHLYIHIYLYIYLLMGSHGIQISLNISN